MVVSGVWQSDSVILYIYMYIIVVQLPGHIWLFVIPWTVTWQDSLTLHLISLPKFMFTASVMLASHFILWCLLLFLPSIFPNIRDFSNELSVRIRWAKYREYSGEYSGFISFKINWFDLLPGQRTSRSLLQNRSWKASILWHSAFFMVHLSQPCVIPGKIIILTIGTFVGRVMPLLSTHFLGLSLLPCQETTIFWFHGCSYHPQWFWSPRRGNPSVLPPLPLCLLCSNGAICQDLNFFFNI